MAEKTGEVSDIITSRRFSLNDAYDLSNNLIDYSSSKITITFYFLYLDYNRDSDGAIKWLLICAVVYGTEVPSYYSSFIEARDKFESLDIRGFATDYFFVYTCLEILQGTSVSLFNSLECDVWRRGYCNCSFIGGWRKREGGILISRQIGNTSWKGRFLPPSKYMAIHGPNDYGS